MLILSLSVVTKVADWPLQRGWFFRVLTRALYVKNYVKRTTLSSRESPSRRRHAFPLVFAGALLAGVHFFLTHLSMVTFAALASEDKGVKSN